MKNILIALLCAASVGCSTLDDSALARTATQAALLYIALEYPETMDEAQTVITIATSDEATREATLKALLDGYLAQLADENLDPEERARIAAIAAFANSVLQLNQQDSGQLSWLTSYLDTVETDQ